jgi:hypothetical protein
MKSRALIVWVTFLAVSFLTANLAAAQAEQTAVEQANGELCGTALDNFNRADGPIGANWEGKKGKSKYHILNNAVEVKVGGPVYWKPQAYGPEQRACVTLTDIDSGGFHGVLMKAQGAKPKWNKGAIIVFYDNLNWMGRVGVKTFVPDVGWTTLALFDIELLDGQQLGGRALADGVVEVYVNSILVGTADAGPFFVDKGGAIGMWFKSPSSQHAILDDFGTQ